MADDSPILCPVCGQPSVVDTDLGGHANAQCTQCGWSDGGRRKTPAEALAEVPTEDGKALEACSPDLFDGVVVPLSQGGEI